jgi:hypothetical protein
MPTKEMPIGSPAKRGVGVEVDVEVSLLVASLVPSAVLVATSLVGWVLATDVEASSVDGLSWEGPGTVRGVPVLDALLSSSTDVTSASGSNAFGAWLSSEQLAAPSTAIVRSETGQPRTLVAERRWELLRGRSFMRKDKRSLWGER